MNTNVDKKLDLDSFKITSVSGTVQPDASNSVDTLGPLLNLLGDWHGIGFNQIWRPMRAGSGSDHFLELNFTVEDLQFLEIPGEIPNRGFFDKDLIMHGLTYMQTVSDSNVMKDGKPAGLHVEPGIWLNIPATEDPQVPASIARLATVPHGTSILAQGIATTINGKPDIPKVDITPFSVDTPSDIVTFNDTDLGNQNVSRTSLSDIPGIKQTMIDDPNSILRDAIDGLEIESTTTLQISTQATSPSVGGGIANTAFLQGASGGPGRGPNAQAARVDATFWVEKLVFPNGKKLLQVQYSQLVLLNFNSLSWPHVSVATLRPFDRVKQIAIEPS